MTLHGAVNIANIMNVMGKKIFFTSHILFLMSIFWISWTQANAGDATLEWKSSLFQRHPTLMALAPVSYCEPGLSGHTVCICMTVLNFSVHVHQWVLHEHVHSMYVHQ